MSIKTEIMDAVVFRWGLALNSEGEWAPREWKEIIDMCHGACLALIGYNSELSEDYADLRRIAAVHLDRVQHGWREAA